MSEIKLISRGLVIAFALSLAACGGAANDPATQQILDSQGTCDNPVLVERPDTREAPAEAVVDGKPGHYVATEVIYFFDLSNLTDHATQAYRSRVARGAPEASSQYSLEVTCNRGYTKAHVEASFDFPDSIDRKDGTIILQTEKFTLNGFDLSSHTSKVSTGHTLGDFLYGMRTVGDSLTAPEIRVYRTSDSALEIVVKLSDFDFFKSNAFAQIHYELR